MQLNYEDYFALAVANRFGRLFNLYNMKIQSLNYEAEQKLRLNPGQLTENTFLDRLIRDNIKQYESTLNFIVQGLTALGEEVQAQCVADMQDEVDAGKAYVAFIEQREPTVPGKSVEVEDTRFVQHASAVLDAYRQRNKAHVKNDILDCVMSESQIEAYRTRLREFLGMRICGDASGRLMHLKARIDEVVQAA